MSNISGFVQSAKDFINQLVDSSFGGVVTYNAFTSTAYSTSTGQDVATYTATTFNGYIMRYKPEEIAQSSGKILEDDVKLVAPIEDLATPTIKDRVTFGGVEYNVISWAAMTPNVRWHIQMRRV